MDKLVLLGAGGHCKSVIDAVEAMGKYDISGILAPESGMLLGYPILGNDDVLINALNQGVANLFIAIGASDIREKLHKKAESIGFSFPNIIDPSAAVSQHLRLGRGIFIGKNAVVNSGCIIKDFAIINSGAVIEHECVVDTFAHVAPGAILCGKVKIGTHTHIGAGAVVRENISVGMHTLIGCASAVVKDIPEHVKAYGNPCKVLS